MSNPKPLKPIIGEVDCLTPGCGHAVPVRENSETKALSCACMWCGAPTFAKADGSAFYRSILARMRPVEASQDVPVAKAPPAAPGTSQHVPAPTPPAPARTSKDVPVAPPAAPKRTTVFG